MCNDLPVTGHIWSEYKNDFVCVFYIPFLIGYISFNQMIGFVLPEYILVHCCKDMLGLRCVNAT